MQPLTNVWSAGVYEIRAASDRWPFLTVTPWKPECETTVNDFNTFVNTAMRFSSKTFIMIFFHHEISIASCAFGHMPSLVAGYLG